MNPFAYALAIFAFGCAACVISLASAHAQAVRPTGQPTGVFIAGTDSVLINRAPAQPGQIIRAGDLIQTDASGRARFSFMDHSTLHLAGNSEVRVDRLVSATSGRATTLIVDMNRGMGRFIAGSPQRREVALVRGGGSLASIQSGVLDMVSSNGRLVTAMRSGGASCRSASGQILTMTQAQRACILTNGGIRPSALSAAMMRAIDERLSVPPSAQARTVVSAVNKDSLRDRLIGRNMPQGSSSNESLAAQRSTQASTAILTPTDTTTSTQARLAPAAAPAEPDTVTIQIEPAPVSVPFEANSGTGTAAQQTLTIQPIQIDAGLSTSFTDAQAFENLGAPIGIDGLGPLLERGRDLLDNAVQENQNGQ